MKSSIPTFLFEKIHQEPINMSATEVEKAKLPNDQNGCLMDANNNPLEKFKATTQITIQKPSTENKSTETNEKAKDINQLFYTGRSPF